MLIFFPGHMCFLKLQLRQIPIPDILRRPLREEVDIVLIILKLVLLL